jgi:two-component system CAI-1 autoinducer sensor kinase/phosphatase CqsS
VRHSSQNTDTNGYDDGLLSTLGRAARYVQETGRQSYEHIEPNLIASGIFGAIAFPAYYIVWKLLFPQSYENLPLRLIGTALCILLALKNHWPDSLQKYQRAFYLFVLLYCLPFFFTYMMLENEASTVWLMSALAAQFLLVLMVDWLHLLLLFTIGTVAAWVTYFVLTPDPMYAEVYFEYFPIFIFVITAGMVFNYKVELIRQERMRATTEAATNVSNELRSPLQSIKTATVGLSNFLPDILQAYSKAKQAGIDVPEIAPNHVQALGTIPERLETDIEHALAVVDMLMMNAGRVQVDTVDHGLCSISQCIEDALKRYPFRSERDRDRVHWRKDKDFLFYGSSKLMTHVVMNVLKNALSAVQLKGNGEVYISLAVAEEANTLRIRDTGTGIPKHLITRVFDSRVNLRSGGGTLGTGLSFCKTVIDQFGGKIHAESETGNFTEIVIDLPAVTERNAAAANSGDAFSQTQSAS